MHSFEQRLKANNDEHIKLLNSSLLFQRSEIRKNSPPPPLSFLPLRFSSQICKDYFTSTILEWESAINWLKQQMQSSSFQCSPAQNLSNEDTDKRSFQRTRSAQFTLEQAQTFLQQTRPTKLNGNDKSTPTDPVDFPGNLIFAGHI